MNTKYHQIQVVEGFDTVKRYFEKSEKVAEILATTLEDFGFEIRRSEVYADAV